MTRATRRRYKARKGLFNPRERLYTTMSQQNFVEQFRLFMEYSRKNSMHSRECMLWVSLFYLANEEATYNADTQTYEWPDDFFEVSNGELNSYGKFDKQAVESLRNRLKQRGLIDFVKGNRNSATPMYKIHYFIKAGNKIIPNNTPNAHTNQQANPMPNNTPNVHTNQQANPIPNNTPPYININNTIPGNPDIDYSDDEDYEEEVAVARAREEIGAAWWLCFERTPTPLIVNELANRAVALEFAPGILDRAIRTAAMKEARSPVDYVLSLLADWHKNKVRTVDDLDEYAYLYDAGHGKLGGFAAMEAGDMLRQFREDRETQEERAARIADEQRHKAEDEQRRAMILANKAAREAAGSGA